MNAAHRVEEILRECQALLENDHFVSVNGYHSSGWVDKDAINPHVDKVSELCRLLAGATAPLEVDIICGPSEGGLIVSLWTGFHAQRPAVYAEHSLNAGTALRGPFILRRGYDRWVKNRRVLVVDDVVNTGHSVLQTLDAVRQAGGFPVGVGCYVDRGKVTPETFGGLPFVYLLQWKIPSWPETETPREILERPVNTRLAHGAEYLARKAAQAV